jgi:hypothetical protein
MPSPPCLDRNAIERPSGENAGSDSSSIHPWVKLTIRPLSMLRTKMSPLPVASLR